MKREQYDVPPYLMPPVPAVKEGRQEWAVRVIAIVALTAENARSLLLLVLEESAM